MEISSLPLGTAFGQSQTLAAASDAQAPQQLLNENANKDELRETFDKFVGETFYSQLLKAMRSTVKKSAYFHGGRGEDIFQAQLDQTLSEKMSEVSAKSFSEPMFKAFLNPPPPMEI